MPFLLVKSTVRRSESLNLISLIAIGLHLKGQKDIAKTFDHMIDLGKNLEKSFDMKLLDESY